MLLPKSLVRRLRKANEFVGKRFGVGLSRWPARGTLEAELAGLFDVFQIRHVVDVGAHVGQFAEKVRSQLDFTGSIDSFEPASATYDILTRHAMEDPRWRVHRHALGAHDTEAQLSHVGADGQCNSLRQLGPHAQVFKPGLSEQSFEAVSVKRLDSIWEDLDLDAARTFLKTDTQGYDLEVTAGAGSLLRDIPCVLMEVAVQPLYAHAPVMSDVLAAMTATNFELTGAFPVRRYRGRVRVIEFDCTFVSIVRLDERLSEMDR